MYEYRAVVKRVIDGDSVVFDIDLGFKIFVSNMNVRLAGIDAAEVRTKDLDEKKKGIEAKEFLEGLLPAGEASTKVATSVILSLSATVIADGISFNASISSLLIDPSMLLSHPGFILGLLFTISRDQGNELVRDAHFADEQSGRFTRRDGLC